MINSDFIKEIASGNSHANVLVKVGDKILKVDHVYIPDDDCVIIIAEEEAMSDILAKDVFTVDDISTELQEQAFVAIRHKVCDFVDSSNNDEIAGYVKGVCEYESLLYSQLQKSYFKLATKALMEEKND